MEEILERFARPWQSGNRSRRRSPRVLAVCHERDEVTRFRQRRDIVTAPPAVLHESSVCCRSGARFSLVHDGDADLVTRLVKRARRIFIPVSEPVSIGDVDVLDVELDSPVIVRLA